jgi:hypothetical protein
MGRFWMSESRVARGYRELATQYQTKAKDAQSDKTREDYDHAAEEWLKLAREAEFLQSEGL